ncbi:unnamed protein product [Natator depressus]
MNPFPCFSRSYCVATGGVPCSCTTAAIFQPPLTASIIALAALSTVSSLTELSRPIGGKQFINSMLLLIVTQPVQHGNKQGNQKAQQQAEQLRSRRPHFHLD